MQNSYSNNKSKKGQFKQGYTNKPQNMTASDR